MTIKGIIQAVVIIARKEQRMLFSFFDVKSEVFGRVLEARTLDEAKRIFISLLLSGDRSNITEYPHDFQLFCLGDFDNVTGKIEACLPYSILSGLEAIQLAKQCSINSLNNLLHNERGDSNDVGNNSSNGSEDSDSD